MPWADKLYGCDARWWDCYDGTGFTGEKWSTHGNPKTSTNDKRETADKYGLNLVRGEPGDGFSLDPAIIHYGENSGFQAINLALLLGSRYIVLIGFDMGGKGHFFGDHPSSLLNQDNYAKWVPNFAKAAELLPEGIRIVNATPGSRLDCFPMMSLEQAIADYRLYRHRTLSDAQAG